MEHYTQQQAYDKVKAIAHKTGMDADRIRAVLKVFDPEGEYIDAHNYHMLIAATHTMEWRDEE